MDIYVFDRSLLTQSFASGVIADPAAHVATLSADLEDEDRDDVIELPNLQGNLYILNEMNRFSF